MAGPWEEYQSAAPSPAPSAAQPSGPWDEYRAPETDPGLAHFSTTVTPKRGFWGSVWDMTLGGLYHGVRDYVEHGPPAKQGLRLAELSLKQDRGGKLSPDEQKELAWLQANAQPPEGYEVPLSEHPWSVPAVRAGEQVAQGDYSGAAGTVVGGYVLPAAIGAAGEQWPTVKARLVPKKFVESPNPVTQDEIAFADRRQIPVSAATRSGNKFVAGAQAAADHSPLGSMVAQQAKENETAAFKRVGNELASEVHPTAVDPLQAGEGAVNTVKNRVAEHAATADTEYQTLRDIEADPANLHTVQVGLDDEGKPVYRDVALPVDMRPYKSQVRSIYERTKTGLTPADQRSSYALLAMENILKADDFIPASQADNLLGALKEHSGMGKAAGMRSMSEGAVARLIPGLDTAVRDAVRGAQRTVKPGETPVPGEVTNEPQTEGATTPQGSANQGESGAVPGAAQPSAAAAATGETRVRVPGETRSYGGRYEVRELSDLEASHNGQTFQRNPNYALTNERDYTRTDNQGKVINWSSPEEFDPSYHITDNPDATNGPLVVDSEGNVLGGNGRKMILDRVYASNPKGAAAYRGMLEQKAGQFGIDPAAVRSMKQPVLVRVLNDSELAGPAAAADAINDFNKKPTAELRPSERAIADSRRVSQPTLDDLAGRIDAAGPDGTLAQALEGKSGVEVLDRLIDDGVITPQERAALAEGDTLTKAGRDRVGGLMLGRFFSDPAALDRVPLSIRGKLERMAAPLARVDSDPAWSLTPHVQQALELLDQAAAHGTANLTDYINQSGLFGEQMYSPEAVGLARLLQKAGPAKLTEMARQYAADANYAQGGALFGDAPTPADAFKAAFGADAGELSGEPTPSAGPRAAAPPPAAPRVQLRPAGAEALGALNRGRAATVAKYEARGVLDELPKKGAEPRQVFDAATWANDAGIERLRRLAAQAPEAMPRLGRAYLEDVLGTQTVEGLKKGAGMFAKWEKLGPETKKLLFKNPALIQDLDRFFRLAKRAADNPNPSGSALVGSMVAGVGYAFTDPVHGVPLLIGAGALSKLLHSPAALRALSEGLTVPLGKGAASVLAAMDISRVAGQYAKPAAPAETSPAAAAAAENGR